MQSRQSTTLDLRLLLAPSAQWMTGTSATMMRCRRILATEKCRLFGEPVQFWDPSLIRKRGVDVQTVQTELPLLPFSVLERRTPENPIPISRTYFERFLKLDILLHPGHPQKFKTTAADALCGRASGHPLSILSSSCQRARVCILSTMTLEGKDRFLLFFDAHTLQAVTA